MPAAQQLPDWVIYGGAILTAVGGFLYTTTGFAKEYWSYKARIREISSAVPKVIDTISGGDIANSIAMGDLTAAVKDLASAIRADTASDEERDKDRLTQLVGELVERLGAAPATGGHGRRA